MKKTFYCKLKNLKLYNIKLTPYIAILFFLISILFSCNNTDNNSGSNLSSTDSNSLKKVDSIEKKTYFYDSLGFVYEELGGWLKMFLDQKTVIDSIGLPETKDKDRLYAYDGSYGQNWYYKTKGIYLYLESDSTNLPKNICGITIKSPCKLKTKTEIGIGSDENKVREKYSKKINRDFSDEENIVIGEYCGCTVFKIKKGKVTEIFIGAIAE